MQKLQTKHSLCLVQQYQKRIFLSAFYFKLEQHTGTRQEQVQGGIWFCLPAAISFYPCLLSDCASPVLSRAHPKAAAISESPLVKGMKSKRVPGSMYPKYSLRSLLGEQQGVGEKRDPATPADGGGRAGTPRTPLLAYSRVAQKPSTITPVRQCVFVSACIMLRRQVPACVCTHLE